MPLAGFIAVKIIPHLIAPRDNPEQLFAGEEVILLAGIQILNRAAQLGQICADARLLIHRAHWAIQKAVGLARRICNFAAAHIDELIHLLAKFGRTWIKPCQIFDKGLRLFFQGRFFAVLNRDEARRLLQRHNWDRFWRGQLDLFVFDFARHGHLLISAQ